VPGDSSSPAPADQRGTDGEDLVLAALHYVRGGLSLGREASGPPTLARQKENLRGWAASLGLLLSAYDIPAKVVRGGQEHEIFHDESTDRYFKVTRSGVFGFSSGIELALVSSSAEGRRFHLWEATPLEYLEMLYLQNLLVPGLNRIEGIIDQAGDEMAIVTSQPRFEIVPVTVEEVDA
jgi:hypothetical protein